MLWRDRVLTRWPGGRCESLDLFWGSDVGQVVSSSGQGLDIVLLSILLARLRKSDWGWGRGVKNLCNGWSKQFFLENMVVLNFDFRNRGHLVHPFQSYGRIYFNIFHIFCEKLVSWPSFSMVLNAGTPSKKCFFQKMWFFGDSGFPSVILVNKPPKALCLSFKMV